jgi:hypothetical protein
MARWLALATLMACGELSIVPTIDAGDASSSDASSSDATLSPDVVAPTCSVQDAGLNAVYTAAEASTSCPPQWSDLTHDGGVPNACTIEGVLCVYPEGQAGCKDDGAAGLRWATNGQSPDCSELPPTECAACSLAPGSVCQYLNDWTHFPPTVDFCCDGRFHQWDLLPDGGCPNDHTCGAIYAKDYDQSCNTADDCARVTEGDLCTMTVCNDCINATVSKRVLFRYEADFDARRVIAYPCPCPSGPIPKCVAGKCTVQ